MRIDNSADIWKQLEELFPLSSIMWDIQGGPDILKERTPVFSIYPSIETFDIFVKAEMDGYSECIATYIKDKWIFHSLHEFVIRESIVRAGHIWVPL
jgi:hypothetical protein